MNIKEAKEILGNKLDENGFFTEFGFNNDIEDEGLVFAEWAIGDDICSLKGEFTADQLEAMAIIMRKKE